MRSLRCALAASAGLAFAQAASADITYFINPFPGAPTVIGQIVTDGTLGAISGSNIVSWTYTTGSHTWSGTGADVQLIGGSVLSASSTNLTFNPVTTPFSFSSVELVHFAGAFINDRLQWFSLPTIASPAEVSLDYRGMGVTIGESFQHDLRGVSSFAIATVPSPGAAALLGAAGLMATRRRR